MITFSEIQQIVCKGEKIMPELLQNKTRKREIVFTRQVVIYFLRKYTKETMLKAGKHYGKDHATVMHCIKVINNLIDTDKFIAEKIRIYDYKIKRISGQCKFDQHLKKMKSGFPVVFEIVTIFN